MFQPHTAFVLGSSLTPSSFIPASTARTAPAMKQEHLLFTVRLATDETAIRKAVQVRHAAYARHVPAMAEKLLAPEPTDYEDGVAVLVAESKLDGAPLGTMRIQTNRFKPLSIEQSIELPDWLQGRPLAEATRLGVEQGRMGTFVKTVLFKAFFSYCTANGIEWMVIAARKPLDRQYDQLMFSDIYPERGFIPMRHGGNIPHRALCFDVKNAPMNWERAGHPMLDFMVRTHHPDLMVGKPMPVAPDLRRSEAPTNGIGVPRAERFSAALQRA